MKIEQSLDEAIKLRKTGKKEESRALLLSLVSAYPNDPQALFQCAWTHDSLGRERDAVVFYERAIESGLKGEDLAGAYLGLGSTLRGLGEYGKAVLVLERGVISFPEKESLKMFLAMAQYNIGESKKSVSSLLKLLVNSSKYTDITAYQRAVLMYAEDLDRKWES